MSIKRIANTNKKILILLNEDFLFMGYKKDIFGIIEYEFELLHNRSFLVKSFAYAHGEIIYSVNCEI